MRPDTDLAVGHTAFVAAGEPFEVRFELINNKEGQNPSQLGVQSVGVNDWLGAGVELKPLQTIQVAAHAPMSSRGPNRGDFDRLF